MGNNLRLSGIILIVLFLITGCSLHHTSEQADKKQASVLSNNGEVLTKTYIYGNNDLLAKIVTYGNNSKITYIIP